MKDIYDWIVSPENRNFLRENYIPSFEEKVQLICGALRPIEEQYAVLSSLSTEADTQEDKELIDSLLWLYDWAFKELREYYPGQIFIFNEYRDRTFADAIRARTEGVDELFHTYDELKVYLNEYSERYRDQFVRMNVKKWVKMDGKMEQIMDLEMCVDNGHVFTYRFGIPWDRYQKMEICFDAEVAHNGQFRTTLPLSFQNGDVVRIDLPVLGKPVYGVVRILDALGRYMYLAYIEDDYLKNIDMCYQDFGCFSGWRVIDWTHPSEISELPPGHELLAEISDVMRRTDLDPETKEKVHKVFYCRKRLLFKTQISLTELLEDIEIRRRR